MATKLYCYQVETAPPRCRPQSPPSNYIFQKRDIATATDNTGIATTSASSRFSSNFQDTRASRTVTNFVRPVAGSFALLPRQQGIYCIKEQQRIETSQSQDRISPAPQGKQQKLNSYPLPCNPADVPWRCHRRSREPVTLRASPEKPQPQPRILRLAHPTHASGAARDTISTVSPSLREQCVGDKCYSASFYQVQQRHSRPAGSLLKLSPGGRVEEEPTTKATTTTTITAPRAAPTAGTGYWGRAPARKRAGTAKEAKDILNGEKAENYKRMPSLLPAALVVDSADGRSTEEEFSPLLQKDSRAATREPFLCVIRPSVLRRRKQCWQQSNPAREVEKHHRLLLHQRLRRQLQLQQWHWQQQHEQMKRQEQLTHTRTHDSEQLLSALEQRQRLPGVQVPPREVVAYSNTTPALRPSPKPVLDVSRMTSWNRRTQLLQRPLEIPLRADALIRPCRASPFPSLEVASVPADRFPYYQNEEDRKLQPQQQRQKKTLNEHLEEEKDRRHAEQDGGAAGRFQMRARGAGTRFGFAAAPVSFDHLSASVCVDQAATAREDFSVSVPCRSMFFATPASASSAPSHSAFSPSLIQCPYFHNAAPHSTTSTVPYVDARAAAIAAAKTTAAASNAGSLQARSKVISDSRGVARSRRAPAPAVSSGSFAALIPRNHRQAGVGDAHAVPCDHRPLGQRLPISYRDVAAACQAAAFSPEFEAEEQQWQEKDYAPLVQQQNYSLQQQQQQRSDHHLKNQLSLLEEEEEQQKQPWRREDTPRERAISKLICIENSAEYRTASPRALWLSREEEESTTASLDYKPQLNNHRRQRLIRSSLPSGASGLGRRFSSTSRNFSAMPAARAAAPRRPFAPRGNETFSEDDSVFAKERSSPVVTLPGWNLWKRADIKRAKEPDGYKWGEVHGRYSTSPHETEATSLFQLRLSVRGYKAGQREMHAILGVVAAHLRRLREQQQHERQQWELLRFRRDTEVQLLRQEKDALKQELQTQVKTSRTEIEYLRKRVTLQQQELQELQEQVLQQQHATTARIEEGEVRQEAGLLKQKLLETQAKERQVQEELRLLEKRLMNKLDESAKHQEEAERAWKEAQQECTQQKTLIEKLLQEQQQRNVVDEVRIAEEQLQLVSKQLSEEKVQRLQINKELQELCQQLSGERTRRMELEKELRLLLEAERYVEIEAEESPESSAGKREQRWQGLRKRHLLLQQHRHVQDAALFKATLEAHRAGIAPHVLQHDQALQSQFEEQGGVEGGRFSVLRSQRRIGLVEAETFVQRELQLRGVKFLQPPERGERRATVATGQVSSKQETLAAKTPRYFMAQPLAWMGKRAKSSNDLYASTGILTASHEDESVNYIIPMKVQTPDGGSGPDISSTVTVAGSVAPAKRALEGNASAASQQKVSLPRMSLIHTTNKEAKTDGELNIDAADIANRAAAVIAVADSPREVRKSVTTAATAAVAKPLDDGAAMFKPVDSAKDSTANSKSAARSREIISEDAAVAVRAKAGVSTASAVSPMRLEGENRSGSAVTSDVTSVAIETPFFYAETKQATLPSRVQLFRQAKPGSIAKELTAAEKSQQGVKIPQHVAHPLKPPMKKRESTPAPVKEPILKLPLPASTHSVASETDDTERVEDAARSLPFEESRSIKREIITKHVPRVEHAGTRVSKTESLKGDDRGKSTVQMKKSFVANKSSTDAKTESAPMSRLDTKSRQTPEQVVAGSQKIGRPEGANITVAKPPSKNAVASDQGVLLRTEETPPTAGGTGDSQNQQHAGTVVSEAPIVYGKSEKDSPSRDIGGENMTAVTSKCVPHTVNVKMSCRRENLAIGLKDTDTHKANHLTERNATVLLKYPPRVDLPISARAVAQRAPASENPVSVRVEHLGLDRSTLFRGEHPPADAQKQSGVGNVSHRTTAGVRKKESDPLEKAAFEAEKQKQRRSSGCWPQRDITEEQSACVDSFSEGTSPTEKDVEFVDVASSTTRSSVEGGDGGRLDSAISGTSKHMRERGDAVRQEMLPTDTGRAKESTLVLPVSLADSVPPEQRVQRNI